MTAWPAPIEGVEGGPDYHWAPAGLTATKHRELAVRAGRADLPPVPSRDRVQERRVLTQAEEAYRTMVFARQRQQLDAAASNGERSKGSRPDSRRSSHPQTPIFSTRIDRARVNATPAGRRRARLLHPYEKLVGGPGFEPGASRSRIPARASTVVHTRPRRVQIGPATSTVVY